MTTDNDVHSALAAEGAALDRILDGLDDAQWDLPTPAPEWTIKHQVAHLASIFSLAAMAAGEPDAFTQLTSQLSDDFDANVKMALAPYLDKDTTELFGIWQLMHDKTEKAVAAVPEGQQVPWLVRPLTADILAAAGMMELFGHGQDIADALGLTPERTDRIKHLVAFAVRTWDFGYLTRGLTPPDEEFRFELTAPSGEQWAFGPEDATQRISGPAVDFCLLATRRRHRDDLGVSAVGSEADAWIDLAQAYRGSPGDGRVPGQFTRQPAAS